MEASIGSGPETAAVVILCQIVRRINDEEIDKTGGKAGNHGHQIGIDCAVCDLFQRECLVRRNQQ